jgi:hypothetical protein
MMNIGMNVRICAARCCAVETSISSIAHAAQDEAQAADLGRVLLQEELHALHGWSSVVT